MAVCQRANVDRWVTLTRDRRGALDEYNQPDKPRRGLLRIENSLLGRRIFKYWGFATAMQASAVNVSGAAVDKAPLTSDGRKCANTPRASRAGRNRRIP